MATVLITGANGSLGLGAVRYLLSQYSTHTLILTVRNANESDPNTANLRSIISQYPNASVSLHQVDLASLTEIKTFADNINNDLKSGKLPRLAAIICNAMTWSLGAGVKYSADGYEASLAVNYLAHFALTLRILGTMDPSRGRIVFLSSDTHWPGKAAFEVFPPVLPDDLERLAKPEKDKEGDEVGRGFQRYSLSKLAGIMCMYELNRRLRENDDLQHIRALAVDPGGLIDSRAWGQDETGIPRLWKFVITLLSWLRPILALLIPTIRRSADAARDVVDVAVGDEFAGQEGHYVMKRKTDSSPDSLDEDMQKKLWEQSVEWCGLKSGDTVLRL